jgi:hypothetical protein
MYQNGDRYVTQSLYSSFIVVVHSLSSHAEVKKDWSYISIPLHAFVVCRETALLFFFYLREMDVK